MTATAVYVTHDLDAEPVGKTYTVRRGQAAAIDLAERIGRDRRLEVVIE